MYCFPELRSIYASLLISEKWNAHCLFSDKSLYFLNYKMNNSINGEFQSTLNSFEDKFSLHLPDINLVPGHVLSNDCNICKYGNESDYPFLNQIEDNLMNYLDIRSYDEINQIKNMVYKINKNLNSKNQFVDSESIIKEYKNQRNQIRKVFTLLFLK